jgi:hypothetical protein
LKEVVTTVETGEVPVSTQLLIQIVRKRPDGGSVLIPKAGKLPGRYHTGSVLFFPIKNSIIPMIRIPKRFR